MFSVKKVRRIQTVSAKRLAEVLASYGDGDAQATQMKVWFADGWKKDTEKGGLIRYPLVMQIVADNHDDTDGGVPDLTGINKDDICNAIDEMIPTDDTLVCAKVGGNLNNGCNLDERDTIQKKEKSESIGTLASLRMAFILSNPSPALLAAYAPLGGKAGEKEFLLANLPAK